MKKYKIFYIDDQSFALPQLIHAIPNYLDYELIYIQRIQDIIVDNYDLVILDFYLDKDSVTALDIIEKFQGQIVLSFSTAHSKNMLMLDKGANYESLKLKGTDKNPKLKKVLQNIFPLT